VTGFIGWMSRRLAASNGLSTVGRIIFVLSLTECMKRRVFTLTTIRWNEVKCIYVVLLFYFLLHKMPTYCCYSVRVKLGEYKGVSVRHIVEWNSIWLVCLQANSLLKSIQTAHVQPVITFQGDLSSGLPHIVSRFRKRIGFSHNISS